MFRRLISVRLVVLVLGTIGSSSSLSAGTVRYQAEFSVNWTADRHAGGIPASNNPHFSPVVGATHGNASFWNSGSPASAGIEQMAETGGTTLLAGEIRSAIAAGTAAELLLGRGLGNVDSIVLEVNASRENPRLTLVSMVAPSPDWFIGIHDLDLRENARWIKEKEIELFAYDAGTDSGLDFTSADEDTQPRVPIRLLDMPLSPTGLPLGKIKVVRLPTLGDWNDDGEATIEDVDQFSHAVSIGNFQSTLDLNQDGKLNLADLSMNLQLIRATNGDSNLDGAVDFIDFLVLSQNFGTMGEAARWSLGDFSANGSIEFDDFLILSSNFGSQSSSTLPIAASVPEPWITSWMIPMTLFGLLRSRRRGK